MNSNTNPATLSRRIGKTIWQGYSPDMSDDAIRDRFMVKYGYGAQEVLRGPSIVLAGPVIQNDAPDAPVGLEMPV